MNIDLKFKKNLSKTNIMETKIQMMQKNTYSSKILKTQIIEYFYWLTSKYDLSTRKKNLILQQTTTLSLTPIQVTQTTNINSNILLTLHHPTYQRELKIQPRNRASFFIKMYSKRARQNFTYHVIKLLQK